MFRILKTTSQKAGLPPGTPVFVGERLATETKITVTDYNKDVCTVATLENAGDCLAYKDKPTVTWLNVVGLHNVAAIEKICECFDIHPLTVEDILNTTQRPKLDTFDDDYLFLVLKMQHYDKETKLLEMEQASFILGKNYLLTFQEKEGDSFEAVQARLKNNKGRIRKMGADYLAYALIDSIVDNYFTVLEEFGEAIEFLEEELVAAPLPETLHKIHSFKREILLLRKSVWPLRNVINSLQRDEIFLVSESISFYLKDLYDHTIQIIETVETFRDIIAGMIDIYLSSISNRMNEVMKVLTIFAAIFIPLTLISGIYGMNFNTGESPYNMPELNWYFGYPFALGLMVTVAGGLLIYFKRKKWL